MRFFDRELILVLAVLVWIELSWPPLFSVGGVRPEPFFIFLAFYAFRIDWKRVVGLGLAVGLIQDFFTNSFFGLEAASYVAGTALLQFFAIRFDRDKRAVQLTSLFFFSWFTLILFSLMARLTGSALVLDPSNFLKALFISVYTTLAGSLLFPVLEKWLKPVFRQRQYELF